MEQIVPTEPVVRTKLAKTSKYYINNKDMTAEVILCKEKNELTKKMVDYFIILANRAILKLRFSNPLDKEDCIQAALLDLTKYWRNFDPAKSTNSFSYFTQISKNAYAKEYKRIHRHIGKDDRVEFVSLSLTGDSDIYTL